MSIEKLRTIIRESDNIVFFGGAGVSTESNIPDFRSSGGLYSEKTNNRYPPEVILSHTFFISHTREFFDFYRSKMVYRDAKPNDAHLSLVRLEREGKLKAVVTQNIDGLHQAAGSQNVYELHGSIHRNYCMDCHKFFSLDYILSTSGIPYCDACGGIVKPDVVLYEEGLDIDIMNKAIRTVAQADVLIVGGTSLTVYPAAGLIQYYNDSKMILINKTATPYDNEASLVIRDNIGKTLRQAVGI